MALVLVVGASLSGLVAHQRASEMKTDQQQSFAQVVVRADQSIVANLHNYEQLLASTAAYVSQAAQRSAGRPGFSVTGGSPSGTDLILYESTSRHQAVGANLAAFAGRQPVLDRASSKPRRTTVRRLEMFGRTWTLRYSAAPGFVDHAQLNDYWLVLLGGLVLTFALAAVASTLVRQRNGYAGDKAAAEQSALAAHDRFEKIFHQTPSGILVCDREGRIEIVNDAMCAVLDRPRVALVGELLPDIEIRGNYAGPIRARLATVADTASATLGEAAYRRPDGTELQLAVTVAAIMGSSTTLLMVRIEDITAKRRAEASIAEAQLARAQLSAVVDSTQDAVCVVDNNDLVVAWNKSAEQLFGYNADEMLQMSFEKVVPGEAHEDYDRLRADFAADRYWSDCETVLQNKAGEPINISMTVSPLRDSSGAVTGRSVIARDISARKSTERLLAMAKEKAEEASRLKSGWLAELSHEVRTPLNGLLGHAELLAGLPLTEEQADHVTALRAAGEGLLNIVNGVLDFSKLEAGRMEIEAVEVDLSELLFDVSRLFKPLADAKGIMLSTRVHPDVPDLVMSDPMRVRQIVSNLVQNATKFTDRGRVSLTAAVVGRNGPKLVVRIEVNDTGIGVVPEVQERLFEAFSQADPSVPRVRGGTGLGLSISSRLAQLLGSRLRMESIEGRGSRFWLDLPMLVSWPPISDREQSEIHASLPENTASALTLLPEPIPVRPAPVLMPPVSESHRSERLRSEQLGSEQSRPVQLGSGQIGSQSSGTEGSSMSSESFRVLVVDDIDSNRALVERMLERLGHEPTIVGSGAEALDTLMTSHFDVILLDCQMPDMDGFETTKRLRQLPSPTSQLPVIALTGGVLGQDRERCWEAGMDDHLAKPVNLAALAQAVLRWGTASRAGKDPVLDDHRVSTLRSQIGAEAWSEIVAMFLGALPEHIDRIRSAAAGHDLHKVAEAAHALRGNAMNLGGTALGAVAAALEDAYRCEDEAGGVALLSRLEATSAALSKELQATA